MHQVIKLDDVPGSTLRSTLHSIGSDDSRFRVIYDEEVGTALVDGPSQYFQLISEVARRLNEGQSPHGLDEPHIQAEKLMGGRPQGGGRRKHDHGARRCDRAVQYGSREEVRCERRAGQTAVTPKMQRVPRR